jgi:predicted Zn-dependent protease
VQKGSCVTMSRFGFLQLIPTLIFGRFSFLTIVLVGACLPSVLLSGCASVGVLGRGSKARDIPSNTVAVDVANAQRGKFEVDAERDSEAIHHFLVGELSLGAEDFDAARKNFERAEELTQEPKALINSKLADLYLRNGELEKAELAAKKAMDESPSEPYVRMLYAGVLEALGREAEAEPIYRALVAEFPAKVDGYLLLSNLYVKTKSYDRAIEVLATLVRNQPNEPAGHYYLGRMYEHKERFDKAEVEYRWVFENDPTMANGSTELLRVLVRQGKTKKVKQVCERIISQDPNNSLARKVLSHIMIGESKLDDALKHLTALESLEEDPSETRFKVALIQIEKQNYREAQRELSLVLAKNPKHAEARYYLASLYAGSGKREEAIEELAEIEKDSPMYIKSRTFAAFILRQDDKLDDALEAVDSALEIEPNNLNLTLYSVLILGDQGEYRSAEKRLRKLMESYPNEERVRFNLAVVLHERGATAESLAEMERVMEVNPRNADALNFIAYTYAQEGRDLERAEKLVNKALEIKPSDGYYLDTLGFVYFKRGKMQQAEEVLARAVGVTGQDPVIVEHYVQVLIAQQKWQQAVGILKTIVEVHLSEEDARDKDKVEALKNLKQHLEEILEARPELSGVQRSLLLKKPMQRGVVGAAELGLVTDFPNLLQEQQ